MSLFSLSIKKAFAFTLAEVLITLAIIGVVAAMTIPTLMSAYRKHVVEIRLEKFYSTISQVIKLSEIDNGPVSSWEYGDISDHRNATIMKAWYDLYFEPYFKKIGGNSSESTSGDVSGNGVFIIYMADGGALRIVAIPGTYATIGYYLNAKDAMVEDGVFLKTSINGKDYFAFTLNNGKNGKFTSLNGNASNEAIINACKNNPKDSNSKSCTRLIERNGWRIPDDYPIKF